MSLIDRLKTTDPDDRQQAIGEAESSTDAAVAEQLAAIICDDDVGIDSRGAAAKALARMPNDSGLSTSLKVLQSEVPKHRELAAKGLSVSTSSEAAAALIQLLTDDVNTVRNVAERSLMLMISIVRKHGIDELLALLQHDEILTRSPAARILGMTGDRRALEPLVKLLGAEQWLARMWACRGLGDLGHEEAFEHLVKAATSDEKNRVRAAAVEALGELRADGTVDVVKQAAEDEDPGVRKVAEATLEVLDQSGLDGEDDPFIDD